MDGEIRYRLLDRRGVYDRAQLRDLIRRGAVTAQTRISPSDAEVWREASAYPELKHYLDLAAAHREAGRARMPQVGWGFFSAVALLVLGLALLAWGLFDVYHGMASKSWPTAEARFEWLQADTRAMTSDRVEPDVYATYIYSVNGRQYRAHRIGFGDELTQRITPRSKLAALRNEHPLLAHYDPLHPDRAVLHAGITFGSMLDLILGALAIGGFVALKYGRDYVWTYSQAFDELDDVVKNVGEMIDSGRS